MPTLPSNACCSASSEKAGTEKHCHGHVHHHLASPGAPARPPPTPPPQPPFTPTPRCRVELRVDQFPLQLLNEYASRLMYQAGCSQPACSPPGCSVSQRSSLALLSWRAGWPLGCRLLDSWAVLRASWRCWPACNSCPPPGLTRPPKHASACPTGSLPSGQAGVRTLHRPQHRLACL